MKKLTTSLILLISFAFIAPMQVSAATANGVNPGTFFYFFDTTSEKIDLFFTFNPEKKAQKALENADERLAEIEAIAEEKNPDAIKTAVANYEGNIAIATEKSKEVKDKGRAEGLLALIENNSTKNQEVLSAVLIKVPEEAREAIEQAISASRKGQEEATRQITELKGEVEQLKKEVLELKLKEVKTEIPPQTTEIEKLKKEVSELKKKQEIIQTPSKQTTTVAQNLQGLQKPEEKLKIVTFPNGAVAEIDTNGNIVRYIKEAPQQTYVPPVSNAPQSQITPIQVAPTVQSPQPSPTLVPSCTQDTWNCSDWSGCSSSGVQTRTCSVTLECSVADTPSPITTQSCIPPAQPVSISVEDISSAERMISITNLSSGQISIEKLRLRVSSLLGKDGASISTSDNAHISLSVTFPKSYDKNFSYNLGDNIVIKNNGIFDYVWKEQIGKNCYGYVDSTAIPKECLRTNTNRPYELLGQVLVSNEIRPNETINIRIALDPRVLAGYSTLDTVCPQSYQLSLDYINGSIVKKSTGESISFPSLLTKEARLNDSCQVVQ